MTPPMTPIFASPTTIASFFEPTALTIVLGGTALATLLRCGFGDVREAARACVTALTGQGRLRVEAVRAHLAVQLQVIARDGLLRANLHHTGDAEIDAGLDALAHRRAIPAMPAAMASFQQTRLDLAETATRTLMQAAELAPVFGLAGTLVSLSHLPANGIDRSAYMAAIGMAVHATLYGLILANLVLAPLGRLAERTAQREEAERARIMAWMLLELEGSAGPRHGGAQGSSGEGGHPATPPKPHTPHPAGPAAPRVATPPGEPVVALFPSLAEPPGEPAPPRPATINPASVAGARAPRARSRIRADQSA